MNAVLKPRMLQTSIATPSSWLGRLSLQFAQRNDRTALTYRRHEGPLIVQRPFYPEGEVCHIYLVHPPGGVVGGDRLQLDVRLEEQSHTLITTPASGKFYRSAGATARLEQQLNVSQNAVLEWLPQDTILFAGCEVDMSTRVNLQAGARFIGWEILCLGRPSSGEQFTHGHCRQRLELWRGNQPLVLDRSRFRGEDSMRTACWGLQGKTVTATLLATTCDKQILAAVREQLDHEYFSATLLDDVLVCRYLGTQGEQARQVFARAWAVIRPKLLGREACPPRVWAT